MLVERADLLFVPEPSQKYRSTQVRKERFSFHRDGVINRLIRGVEMKTPHQPVNNAGEAIQI